MSNDIQAVPQNRGVMSIVPKTFDEAMRIASALAKSSMVPACYRNKPDDVFAAMELGSRLGMGAMQSLQNIAPINGKPSVFGDGFLGIIQSFPDYAGHDEDNADTALAQGFGRCKMRRRMRDGSIKEVEQRITVDMAKKAGWWGKAGPWTGTPGRMLQWRARSWSGRDLFADRLCGISSAEEAMDCVVDATATVVGDMMPRSTDDAPPPPVVDTTATVTEPNPGEVAVTVVAVETKTGETNGKPWKKHGVKVRHDDGVEDVLGTFHDTPKDVATSLVGKRAWVTVTSKEKDGRTLLTLESIRPC